MPIPWRRHADSSNPSQHSVTSSLVVIIFSSMPCSGFGDRHDCEAITGRNQQRLVNFGCLSCSLFGLGVSSSWGKELVGTTNEHVVSLPT